MKRILIFALIFYLSLPAAAKHIHPEKYYQTKWCKAHKGKMEYRLKDGTRVDCLTDKYAVEIDFATKYHECLGQAQHYSARTGKQGACVLIIENPEHMKYVYSLRKTIQRKNLHVRALTIKPVIELIEEDVTPEIGW